MKKLLSIFCVAIVMLTASSCKKETVVAPSVTLFRTASNWTLNQDGITYTADVSVPEIDSYYDNNGAVLVYNDLGNGEYELLPSVFSGSTYSVTFTGGHVYIDAQSSDGVSPISVPPTLNLKIVLVD